MTEINLICLSLLLNGSLWKKLPSTISFLDRQALPRVVLSTMFVKPIPSSKSFLSSSELMGRGNKPDKNMHFPAFFKKKLFQKKPCTQRQKVEKNQRLSNWNWFNFFRKWTDFNNLFLLSNFLIPLPFFSLSFVTFSPDFSPFSCMSFNYRNLC